MKYFFIMFLFFPAKGIFAQSLSDLKEIIKYGTYAPSSHNAQMWKLNLEDDRYIVISVDDNRLLPFIDPLSKEAWISIGAFVENCILAASDLGYACKVDYNNNKVKIEVLKHVLGINKTDNIRLINKRLTIRCDYIPNIILDSLVVKELKSISDNIVFVPREEPVAESIINMSVEACRVQCENKDIMNELSEFMSFSYRQESSRDYGISPEMLNITGVKHFLFNMFMNPKSVNSKSFKSALLNNFESQMKNSSAYILISSNSFTQKDLLDSGRILERIYLYCANKNIAIQPMSQVLEESTYYNKLKKILGFDKEVHMFLRIGKVSNYPVRKSKRLSVDTILL